MSTASRPEQENRAVWKYSIPIDGDVHHIEMPATAQVLHVKADSDARLMTFWAEVGYEEATEQRSFTVVGTGHPIPRAAHHRGTHAGEIFVWHLYDLGYHHTLRP